MLVIAGLPSCFWPFAGMCFAVHARLANGSYAALLGENAALFMTFVFGQLVFYRPAPTIYKPSKVDSPLRPGIFLGYYNWPGAKFSGQYICVDLEDFVGKSLHAGTSADTFTLSFHRTEVVRDPVGPTAPIFPLKRKYMKANYTIEGLEG